MNQISDQLKKEDGIKVRKLSDKKLLVTSTIPIVVNSIIIYNYKLKARYQLDEHGIYIKIWPRTRFFDIISMSWGIKKKCVYLSFDKKNLIIDGYKLSGLFDKIEFKDPIWSRNWKINIILNENS